MPSDGDESLVERTRKSGSAVFDRARAVGEAFLSEPLNGSALKTIFNKPQPDTEKITGLEPPMRCEGDASVIVAHYASYAAEDLASFWHTVVPEIEAKYGSQIRYEHHDAPVLASTATSYQLATIGREIQHEMGVTAFWDWFDLLMDRGVAGVDEGFATGVEIGIERDTLEAAVRTDKYERVIRRDAKTAAEYVGDNAPPVRDQGISSRVRRNGHHPEKAIFVVTVNGSRVKPTYESIAGEIESFKYGNR